MTYSENDFLEGNHFNTLFMISKFQYAIIGAGSAGLQLAKALLDMNKARVKSIILIDKSDTMSDKTWCFWCNPKHQYSSLVKKEWQNIEFKSPGTKILDSIYPLSYQYIRSKEFYDYHKDIFKNDTRITQVFEEVNQITADKEEVLIHLGSQLNSHSVIKADYVFCTDPSLLTQNKIQPKIWQHFIGWIIETKKDCFQTQTFTMMDFNLENNKDMQFMYVLPLSSTKALVECTVFSKEISDRNTYEKYIKDYIKTHFTVDYDIIEVEVGKIPMQLSQNYRQISKRIVPIGTAAGCIKASTGYSFTRNMENTAAIIRAIERNSGDLTLKHSKKFRLYDTLLLDIIGNKPSHCATIFSQLFKNNSVKMILKFLDEKTTIYEDIKIFYGLPKMLFFKTLIKNLLSRS